MLFTLWALLVSNAGKFTTSGFVHVDVTLSATKPETPHAASNYIANTSEQSLYGDSASSSMGDYLVITVSNTRSASAFAPSDPELCFVPFRGMFDGQAPPVTSVENWKAVHATPAHIAAMRGIWMRCISEHGDGVSECVRSAANSTGDTVAVVTPAQFASTVTDTVTVGRRNIEASSDHIIMYINQFYKLW